MNAGDADRLARRISWTYERRSPVALTSAPDEPVQRLVGIKNGTLVVAEIEGPLVGEGRDELKARLRRLRHPISDIGLASTMSTVLIAAYASMDRKTRRDMGFELPRRLALILIRQPEVAAAYSENEDLTDHQHKDG